MFCREARHGNADRDGERQAVGVTGGWVRVLSEDHDPDVVVGGQLERSEGLGRRREDIVPLALLRHERKQLVPVALRKLALKSLSPVLRKQLLAVLEPPRLGLLHADLLGPGRNRSVRFVRGSAGRHDERATADDQVVRPLRIAVADDPEALQRIRRRCDSHVWAALGSEKRVRLGHRLGPSEHRPRRQAGETLLLCGTRVCPGVHLLVIRHSRSPSCSRSSVLVTSTLRKPADTTAGFAAERALFRREGSHSEAVSPVMPASGTAFRV